MSHFKWPLFERNERGENHHHSCILKRFHLSRMLGGSKIHPGAEVPFSWLVPRQTIPSCWSNMGPTIRGPKRIPQIRRSSPCPAKLTCFLDKGRLRNPTYSPLRPHLGPSGACARFSSARTEGRKLKAGPLGVKSLFGCGRGTRRKSRIEKTPI